MYRTKPSICFPSRRTWTGSNGTSSLLQIPTGELFLPWSDETELLCLYDDNKDDDVDVKDDVDDNDDDDGRSQVWVHAQQRQNVEEEHGGFCNHDDNLKFFFHLLLFQIKHKLQHQFLFEISISGGKPWFNLYWSRFESKLSWRVILDEDVN